MTDFKGFIDMIDDFKDKPVRLKAIKQILKIQEKSFPCFKNIQNYFYSEFSKRTNEEHRTKWHRKDKIIFIWSIMKYFELKKREDLNPIHEDWEFLSSVLKVQPHLLNLKWLSMLKTNLKIAPWQPEEDQLLNEIIEEATNTNNWTQIAINFNQNNPTKMTRHAKQIRERWNNYLNPELKKQRQLIPLFQSRTEWNAQEQAQLIQKILDMGKKWSQIAQVLEGRNENQVKNQFNSIMNAYKRENVIPHTLYTEEEILKRIQRKLLTDEGGKRSFKEVQEDSNCNGLKEYSNLENQLLQKRDRPRRCQFTDYADPIDSSQNQQLKQKKVIKEKIKKQINLKKVKLEEMSYQNGINSEEDLENEEQEEKSEESSSQPDQEMVVEKKKEQKVVAQSINSLQNENLKQISLQQQQFQQQQLQQQQQQPLFQQQLQQQPNLNQGQNKQGTPNIQNQPGMINYPAFSPLTMNFHTPLSYFLQQSPQGQSPFDITKQNLYQSQCNQLFEDLLKSKNLTVDQLRVINRTQFPWLQKQEDNQHIPSSLPLPSMSYPSPPIQQIQQFLQQQQNIQQMQMQASFAQSISPMPQQFPYFQTPGHPDFMNLSNNATIGSANESYKKDFNLLQQVLYPNQFQMSPFNLCQPQMTPFKPMIIVQNPNQNIIHQEAIPPDGKPPIKKIKNLKEQLRNFDNIKKE